MTALRMSIVTPCLNGASYIGQYLEAVLNQDYGDYEIVVVDNGSSDSSRELLEVASETDRRLRLITYFDVPSSYAARNAGVAVCKGKILAFTDIDCRPSPEWVSQLVDAFERQPQLAVLSGAVELYPKYEQPNIYEQVDIAINIDQEAYSLSERGATANLAVKREVFDALNGFEPVVSGGDLEFCARAIASGHRFAYCKEATVRHPARNSWSQLSQKERRKAIGLVQRFFSKKRGLRESVVFLLIRLLGLLLQPQQWRRSMSLLRKGSIPPLRLSKLIGVIFGLGYVYRWTATKATLVQLQRSRWER